MTWLFCSSATTIPSFVNHVVYTNARALCHADQRGAYLNTLRPTQNGRHFPDDIFKWIFLNENIWISIKISVKFVPKGHINNTPALVQIMAWRRQGDKQLSEPMMVSLLTHTCVNRPQWVKAMYRTLILCLLGCSVNSVYVPHINTHNSSSVLTNNFKCHTMASRYFRNWPRCYWWLEWFVVWCIPQTAPVNNFSVVNFYSTMEIKYTLG